MPPVRMLSPAHPEPFRMRRRDQIRTCRGNPIPHHSPAHFYLEFDRSGNHRWRRQSSKPYVLGEHGYAPQRNTVDVRLCWRIGNWPSCRVGSATGGRPSGVAPRSRLFRFARFRARCVRCRGRFPRCGTWCGFRDPAITLRLNRIRRCRVLLWTGSAYASSVVGGLLDAVSRKTSRARQAVRLARLVGESPRALLGRHTECVRGGRALRSATRVRRCCGRSGSRRTGSAGKAVSALLSGGRRAARNGPVDVFRDDADVSHPTGGQTKRVRRVVELREGQAHLMALHRCGETAAHQLLGDGSGERGRGGGYCGQQCPARGGQSRQFGPGHPGIEPSAFAHPAIVWRSGEDRSSLWHEPRSRAEGADHASRSSNRRHRMWCGPGDSGHRQPESQGGGALDAASGTRSQVGELGLANA